jgi:endonuclease YncB( thermonuclease family)
MAIRLILLCVMLAWAWPVPAHAAGEIVNNALVQDDGTLRVQGRTIRLFGIYIPDMARTCRSDFSPPLCGSRAANALNLKIQGFVRCRPQAELADGSTSAVCYADDTSALDPPVDLGAYLIEQGWAVATPDAPFEYGVRERIARSNGRGVWGMPVDRILR